MKGKIIKVTLNDFMTYDKLVLVPGDFMNMIVGPNGSGKSSILCGLCLGLAGKANSIGRVTKLSAYIKNGCNQASIEIELRDGKHEAILTRVIKKGVNETSGGTSAWSLNGKTAQQRDVEKFVNGLNINMDNLCQYLSQERVQDFSKMNAKELLINTEKTVGSSEMYENHQKLIELCKSGGGQEKNLDNAQQSLTREKQRLEMLQKKMESMKERLALVKEIKNVQSKIPWVEYNEKVDRAEEVKRDKQQASARLGDMEKDIKPLEKEVGELNQRLKVLRAELRNKTSGPASAMTKFIEDQDKIQQEVNRTSRDLKAVDDEEKKFKADLLILEQRISTNQSKLQELEGTYDADRVRQEILKFTTEIRDHDNYLTNEHNKHTSMQAKIRDIVSEIRAIDHEKSMQSNVAQKRLTSLNNICRKSLNASQYLKNDLRDHPFHGNVYPSIMLEINVNDPRASKYFNSTISRRDKIALLCERREDFNDLFIMLKDKFGKGLNMLVQGTEAIPIHHPVPLNTLREMGFDNYLSNLIECPTEIFNFLCKNYRIHTVPVAYREGSVDEKRAMQSFTSFFIGENSYRVNTSRYTGEKSTRISQVNTRNNPFEDSTDQNALARAEAKKGAKENEKAEIESKMTASVAQMREKERARDTLRNKLKETRAVEGQVNELRTLVKRSEATRRSKLEQGKDFGKDKEKIIERSKKLYKTLIENVPNFKKHMKKCVEYSLDTGFASIEVTGLTRKIEFKADELKDKKNAYENFKRTVMMLEDTLKRVKQEASELRKRAEKEIGCGPNDPEFRKIQEIFTQLPNTIIELDALKTDLESRLEFMEGGNENVAEQLEAQKKKCLKLKQDVANLIEQVTNRKANMDALREKWLPALEELSERINVKFGRLFNYMACEGEVHLIKGNEEVEDDYENFGLTIRVSFREGQAMQELGSTQSGGERSVSTAIYLLALQELTDVPFRCLDEINQGMDATNERRIMELMMSMSSAPDSCQYFLVSPKLLPNMKYAKTSRVLCVQQPMRMKTTKWVMEKFILKKQMEAGEKKPCINAATQEVEQD